jgi:ABC-type branched-chain amino acid transport systems, periplasmic component
MQRRRFIKAFALSAAAVGLGLAWSAQAADTIKVGILSSLSGTMAISETPLKDVALMTIDEINAKGGVLGKSWSRWWWIRPPTGRCSPRRRASC